MTETAPAPEFVERRLEISAKSPDRDRRQFSNSYDNLSIEARELATAIDEYKLIHRRRYVTYEEMLSVVLSLGYHKG